MESLRQKLEQRVQSASRGAGGLASGRVEIGDEAPASTAQQGLWVVNELTKNTAFTVPVLHRIEGPLSQEVLARVLRALVERHPVLRTVFREEDGDLIQVVEATPSSVLRVHDLSGAKPGMQEAHADRLVAAQIATPFNLTSDLPFRATLIRLGAQDHWLLLTIHHIACDQWSMGIFATELSRLYEAEISGGEAVMSPLPTSYVEFARRQHGQDRSEGIGHFVERAAGVAPLQFATDRARPARVSYSGDERALWLGPEQTRRLQGCARALGVSPFIVTLAAFLTIARTHGRSDDFVFGTSSAGRHDEELSGLVGFFVNTLVLRATIDPDETFADLVQRSLVLIGEAQDHASTPFDAVVKALGASGDGTGRTLTPVMFQQDNTPGSAFAFTGCASRLDDNVNSRTAKYELLFSIRNQSDDTRLHVQFDTDLFDGERLESFLAGVAHCLGVACEDPLQQVRHLPSMCVAEAEQINSFNATEQHLPGPDTLHGLVLAQARTAPSAIALSEADGSSMSYDELAREATHVSAALARRGVGAGDTVLVQVAPGRAYLTATLAILMAGAAFVPVDPGYPEERVKRIRELAGAKLEISTAHTVRSLVAEGFGHQAPHAKVTADDTAYVIFTSGSTGHPKGVQVCHGGISNNLKDLARLLNLGPQDRCLAVSSTSFDMSIFEAFGVLAAGGATVTLHPDARLEPEHWAQRACAGEVSVWNSAPALLGLFLDTLESGAGLDLPPLRTAVLGGDWVPLSMPSRWWSLFPTADFHVLGGATEASIHSTYTLVTAVDPAWKSIPYGRPMANQKAIVVDTAARACPIGVPGRLLLGGTGLAAGYFGDPALTDAAFVVRADGGRWYETGDVARWSGDGALELLGRSDNMIKLNGLRIEPGEVESALLASGPYTETVVLVAGEEDARLIAVLESDTKPDVTRLRSRLSEDLPSYMIPAEFYWVTRMPLNSNGKLDRGALRDLTETVDPVVSHTVQAPLTTAREQHIALVWSQVLQVDVTSSTADFFDLGGDSFKAVKAARMVAPDLSTVALFRHPTVGELAAYLDAGAPAEETSRLLVPLSDASSAPRWRLVCVPYGGGNAVAYQPLANCLGDEVEVLAVNLPGHDLADTAPLQPIGRTASQVASELSALPAMPTAIYAQCAGCATADRLVRACVEAGVDVSLVFMGAALPDPDPASSMTLVREGDDDLLLGHMRGLGGFDGVLDDSDLDRILRVVRHDLMEMVQMYLDDLDVDPAPVDVPVHCIVGGTDPATTGYESRYLDWVRVGTPVTLAVLPNADHYFCTTDPGLLAEEIRIQLGLGSALAGTTMRGDRGVS